MKLVDDSIAFYGSLQGQQCQHADAVYFLFTTTYIADLISRGLLHSAVFCHRTLFHHNSPWRY